ncbi:MarR family transcriptional regulator [Roseomonas elaeocarpi]|uniref:MarR family transcriptional regulator n=1 Tax=Roseomonas elaeocarpi TaxID=907779 RepID=A0ABV6JZ85_9PROT
MISAAAAVAAPPSPNLVASPDALADLRHNGALQIIRLALKPLIRPRTQQDLTARSTALLMHLAFEQGPHTVGRAAEALELSKPVICREMDALARCGLTVRRDNPKDGRAPHLVVTRRGQAVLERLGALDTGIV